MVKDKQTKDVTLADLALSLALIDHKLDQVLSVVGEVESGLDVDRDEFKGINENIATIQQTLKEVTKRRWEIKIAEVLEDAVKPLKTATEEMAKDIQIKSSPKKRIQLFRRLFRKEVKK